MPRMSRKTLIIVSIALMAGGLWWVRRSVVNTRVEKDYRAAKAAMKEAARSAEAVLASLGTTAVSLQELEQDRNRWEEVLRRAMVCQSAPGEPVMEDEATRVLSVASDFLAQRFGASDDAQAYIDWRRQAGYQPCSLDEMGSKNIAKAYEAIVGSPMPPDATPEDLFITMFRKSIDGQSAHHIPALIGAAPGSVVVAFKWSEIESHPDFPLLDAGLGKDVWYSGLALGYGLWWKPPHSYYELLRDRGRVLLSSVGITMQSKSGDWKTLQLNFLFDAGLGKWFLVSAFHYNADMESARVPWMY